MGPTSKLRSTSLALLTALLLLCGGCVSYQANQAYEKGVQMMAAENYDAAIELYSEASQLEPSSRKYRLELLALKTKAAAAHLKNARQMVKQGQLTEALIEYRLAQRYHPGLTTAVDEEAELRRRIEAQQHAMEASALHEKGQTESAETAVDMALNLDPNNALALDLKHRIDREHHAVFMDGVVLDLDSDEPINLSFRETNVREVFGILSRLSGINFIFDEDIRSRSISVLLENGSFLQAMELILQMNGLDRKVLNSKTIIIFPKSRDKEKQYGDQIIQTFYLSHIDAKKAVNLLRTMLQLRKVYVHEERNAIILRDRPDVIRLAEQVLAAADRSDSEVLFDLELVSVSEGDALNLGLKLSRQAINVGLAQPGEDGPTLVRDSLPLLTDSVDGLVNSLNGLDAYFTLPSAQFDFLKTLESTETLANPKVRVKNNEKAKVHVGSREPVITATNNNGVTTESIQYVDVGIKLDVEPIIQLDGTVLAGIKLEVSDATYLPETDSGTTPIRIRTTNAETKLVLKDGERTILGGLLEQASTRNKTTIPGIGDIPLLGRLFSNFDNMDIKRQILLSITPHIIRNVDLPKPELATLWSGGEDDLKFGPNFGSFSRPLASEVESTSPQTVPSHQPAKALQLTTEFLPQPAMESQPQPVMEAQPQPAVPVDEIVPTEQIAPDSATAAPEPAGDSARIALDGPAQAELGQDFSVVVSIENVQRLYSAPLLIKYDQSILELAGVEQGDFLGRDGQTTDFSSNNYAELGRLMVDGRQQPGGMGASGAGDLYRLTFKPIATGTAQLSIGRVIFHDPAGEPLPVNATSLAVEVR